ncbi:hypothetical protein M153_739000405 [Pseudoloma neurophilia]|uniref:Uncharacterized protein n=1 Tax=Pseudoloma neurophilia TaxID=146866 RepID=A0A0R0M2B8_9MICR|nr:hypothetical protein M153_739000405 [Pseudoloma neurophilia]
MDLDDITNRYPEIGQFADQIMAQNDTVRSLLSNIIRLIENQHISDIEKLQNENLTQKQQIENYKAKYEYTKLEFPLGTRPKNMSSSVEESSFNMDLKSGTHVNMPDSQMTESKIFPSLSEISERSLLRANQNSKMFNSQFEYDMQELEKKILNVLNFEFLKKLGHQKQLDQSRDLTSSNLINSDNMHSILDKKSGIQEDSESTATQKFIDLVKKEQSFVQEVSNSSFVNATSYSNVLELEEKLFKVKQENARLSRELNYMLSSSKVGDVDGYIKNYYEIVDLLKEKLTENSLLKNNMFMLTMKLENIEKALTSFIKTTVSDIIKETLSTYRDNLVYFFTEVQKLEIENSNLKIIEIEYQKAMTDIFYSKQLKQENDNLKNELKTLTIKNSLINSLENRITAKNNDIIVLESRNQILREETTRLLGLLTEKERIISNMVIEDPIKNRIVELESLRKEFSEKEIAQKEKNSQRREIFTMLKQFYEQTKFEILDLIMIIKDIFQFYQVKKQNELKNFIKKHTDQINIILREKTELLNILETHRDQSAEKDQKITKLMTELQNLQTNSAALKHKMDKKSEQLNILETENKNLTSRLEKLKKDSTPSDLHSLLELERKETEQQLQFYKNKCEEYEIEKFTDIKAIKEQNQRLTQEKEEISEEFQLLKEKNYRLEEYANNLFTNHENIQKQLEMLTETYNTLKNEHETLKNQHNKILEQNNPEKHQNDDIRQQLTMTRQKYNELYQKYEQTASELKSLQNSAPQSTVDQDKKIENLKLVILKLKEVNQKLVDQIKQNS